MSIHKKNDFDLYEWAAPDILEQADRELPEDEWKKRTTEKLQQAVDPLQYNRRIG